MKEIVTYLMFDGNCREAMTFYQKCVGADLQLVPYSEAPGEFFSGAKDRIMHAQLSTGSAKLMASDFMPGTQHHQGNNFSISLDCEGMDEIQKLFAAFGENGKITMPLQDTFWGAHFGMLTDQFGINWMFNFDKAKRS